MDHRLCSKSLSIDGTFIGITLTKSIENFRLNLGHHFPEIDSIP